MTQQLVHRVCIGFLEFSQPLPEAVLNMLRCMLTGPGKAPYNARSIRQLVPEPRTEWIVQGLWSEGHHISIT